MVVEKANKEARSVHGTPTPTNSLLQNIIVTTHYLSRNASTHCSLSKNETSGRSDLQPTITVNKHISAISPPTAPQEDSVSPAWVSVSSFQHLDVIIWEPHKCKIQSKSLEYDGAESKLNTDTSGKAAGPHRVTGKGIGTLHGSANCVVPNIHDAVPSDEGTIK